MFFMLSSSFFKVESPMVWLLNTNKHYKIWFSDAPETFLDMENQLRFIRAREKNPDVHFGFVYSSALLSAKAVDALKKFCTQQCITAIDFDVELPKLLQHDLDKKIYDLAKKEMHHPGGCLAAASDCVRTLIPVIELLGLYSDFDVGIAFATVPKQVPINYPVILPVDYKESAPSINMDFMAAAHLEQDPQKLHPEAITCIQNIQRNIIKRYANPFIAFFTPNFRGLGTIIQMDHLLRGVLADSFK